MAYEVPHQIERLPAVLRARGCGHTKHYQDIKDGLWSRPVACGARSVGWPLREVMLLNAARVAGKSDEEVRALVTELETARSSALDEAMAMVGMRQKPAAAVGARP